MNPIESVLLGLGVGVAYLAAWAGCARYFFSRWRATFIDQRTRELLPRTVYIMGMEVPSLHSAATPEAALAQAIKSYDTHERFDHIVGATFCGLFAPIGIVPVWLLHRIGTFFINFITSNPRQSQYEAKLAQVAKDRRLAELEAWHTEWESTHGR
jgi:hypothetical protein